MPSILHSKPLRISLGNYDGAQTRPAIIPGTVLYGEVLYKPAEPSRITTVTVNLLGKLVVKANGQREVTQLFSVAHPIRIEAEDEITVDTKGRRFPFHFIVPWTTEYDRTGTYQADPDGVFAETPHLVPPTLEDKNSDAKVEYSIYVVARRKGITSYGFNPRDTATTGTELEGITCILERAELSPGPPSLVRHDFKPPSTGSTTSGILRRMSKSADDTSMPTASTALQISTPTSTVVLGQPYTFTYDVFGDMRAPFEGTGYTWTLEIQSIELQALTHRRTKASGEILTDRQSFSLKWSLLGDAPGSDAQGVKVRLEPLSEIIPSFKSYTISRTHRLRVNVSNAVKGKDTKEVQSILIPVELVKQGDILARRTSSLAAPAENFPTDEMPPPYEESPIYQR